MSPDSKRRLLYNKRVAPKTFVLFFHNGASETSWSVRDYSGRPVDAPVRYWRAFT